MNIEPKIKEFNVLPLISFKKYINTLSEQSKKSFEIEWKDFYTIEIGWLVWYFEIKIY